MKKKLNFNQINLKKLNLNQLKKIFLRKGLILIKKNKFFF